MNSPAVLGRPVQKFTPQLCSLYAVRELPVHSSTKGDSWETQPLNAA